MRFFNGLVRCQEGVSARQRGAFPLHLMRRRGPSPDETERRGESGDRGFGGKGGVRAPFPQTLRLSLGGVWGTFSFGKEKVPHAFAAHAKSARWRGLRSGRHGQQQPPPLVGTAIRGGQSVPQRRTFVTASRSLTQPAPLLRPHPATAQPGSGNWGLAANAPHCSPARPGHGRSRGNPVAAE